MIFQYCLSVYGLNFFNKPTFTTFKIRIINQQNGDCSDSRILDSKKLDSSTFPVLIKIKGTQRLLIKVKLLHVVNKSGETAIGQGVVSFDKNNIDDSLRVPIYDKKKGVEQVAICSLDLFISGHQLDKNMSVAIDKSKNKINDWRNDSEDAIFSQMSFTVQSDKELDQQQIVGKIKTPKSKETNKLQPRITEFTKETKKNSKESVPNKIPLKQEKKVQKENLQDQSIKQGYALQNSVYLSESSRKQFEQSKIHAEKQYNNQDVFPMIKSKTDSPINKSKQIWAEKQRNKEDQSQSDNSLSPQRIRDRIKQNQDLMQKLRRYLETQKKTEDIYNNFRQPRHKLRKRKVKIQDLGAYSSGNSFVKYYKSAKDTPYKLLNRFKVTCSRALELNDNSTIQHEIIINKLSIFSFHQEKLAIFDGIDYRSFCQVNNHKEVPFSMHIPEEQTIKVILTLQKLGDFEGTLGVQEGQNMAIKLSPCLNNKITSSVLSQDSYQFKFCIEKAKITAKPQIETRRNYQDVSFKQPEQIFQNEDIRTRIRSLSLQPWGYSKSYIEGLKPSGDLVRTKTQERPSTLSKVGQDFSLDKKVKRLLPMSKQQFKSNKNDKNLQKIMDLPYQGQSQLHQQSQNLSLQSSKYQGNTQLYLSKKSKNEIKDINRIRNGNRNNYRFKESRVSVEKNKQSNIKQMWERLLIKKKIEEDRLERSSLENTRKQSNKPLPLQQKQNNTEKHGSHVTQKTGTANLYGHAQGSNNLVRIKPSNGQQVGGSRRYPLRSMTVEVKNISITEPEAVIMEDAAGQMGKFVRLSIKDRVTYYTQIIFNGEFNSILWKLSGCLFTELLGSEKLEVQIFKTFENQITFVGKASIRISKLYFLRNNHIYNGHIISAYLPKAQFTLGFSIQQFYPFQVVEQSRPPSNRQSFQEKKQTMHNNRMSSLGYQDAGLDIRQTKEKLAPLVKSINYERMKNKAGQDLKDTLRRQKNSETELQQRQKKLSQASLIQEQSELMPKGLQLFY